MDNLFNPHPHGIMFHHFHGGQHPVGQGSLSAEQFSQMLDWLAERYTILQPVDFLRKLNSSSLAEGEVCLTFDDALLCQAEIAAPILKNKNLGAFFFVYSAPFMGDPDNLEVYRYFRSTEFATVDDFYGHFFAAARMQYPDIYIKAEVDYDPKTYLAEYAFYTLGDRWFRFLRDRALGPERYNDVMLAVMRARGFDKGACLSRLWMTEAHLVELRDDGHTIGLHSYSHPTTFHLLDRESQREEYCRNQDHLAEVLGARPVSMSHPLGNYNSDSLEVLAGLGVQIGFRDSNSTTTIRSRLEVPREDHMNVLKEMCK